MKSELRFCCDLEGVEESEKSRSWVEICRRREEMVVVIVVVSKAALGGVVVVSAAGGDQTRG